MQKTSALLVKYTGSVALSSIPGNFAKTVEAASKAVESEVSYLVSCLQINFYLIVD